MQKYLLPLYGHAVFVMPIISADIRIGLRIPVKIGVIEVIVVISRINVLPLGKTALVIDVGKFAASVESLVAHSAHA